MNALNAEVNALKRHVTTADAEDEEDDRRSVASGASSAQWGNGVRGNQPECNDDDNVYQSKHVLTEVNATKVYFISSQTSVLFGTLSTIATHA